jgi:hypothetical protein
MPMITKIAINCYLFGRFDELYRALEMSDRVHISAAKERLTAIQFPRWYQKQW